jgi:hypothetical protein
MLRALKAALFARSSIFSASRSSTPFGLPTGVACCVADWDGDADCGVADSPSDDADEEQPASKPVIMTPAARTTRIPETAFAR